MDSPAAVLIQSIRQYQDSQFCSDQALVQRFCQFVQSSSSVFDRNHLPGHLTASAWIVDPRADAVLLTHHKKLNRWLQLGGHADGDSDLLRVARREVQEESGLVDLTLGVDQIFDLDIHEIPGEPAHEHYDVRFLFVLGATDSRNLTRSEEESNELKWVPIKDLGSYDLDPSIQRMVRKVSVLTSAWH